MRLMDVFGDAQLIFKLSVRTVLGNAGKNLPDLVR